LDLGQFSRGECLLELKQQVGADEQVLRFFCGESKIPEHVAVSRQRRPSRRVLDDLAAEAQY
jgi:hypothetical protein